MALPTELHALSIGSRLAPHVLELYVDYQCPFSAKILRNFDQDVVPLIIGEGARFKDQVRVVVRPTPQPWHVSSMLTHESALAVARIALDDPQETVDPSRNAFWIYSQALMREQERFFDNAVRSKTPDQVRGELATIAVNVLGEDIRRAKRPAVVRDLGGQPLGQAVKNWTKVSDEGNTGSAIVPDLKYAIKIGRQNSIHITPTALWNGVVEPSISSSFGQQQWIEFLEQRTRPSKA